MSTASDGRRAAHQDETDSLRKNRSLVATQRVCEPVTEDRPSLLLFVVRRQQVQGGKVQGLGPERKGSYYIQRPL